MTQTYYTKDIDGEYSVAQPQPTLREMEPEDTDDTMSVAERAVRIVLAKAKGVCLSKVHAIDHAGNSYLREASATQCANAIGALNIQPLIDQVHGILSLPTQPEPHPDDIAVDRFAAAMKAKMARSRDCGRYGWDDPAVCSAEDLRLFLVNHIAKGDPVDVGNFAMMLFNRGETTATKHRPEPPADVARDAESAGYLYTNVQSGEHHVSDYDDDYRGPERAMWHIEPVYRRAKGRA